MASDMSPISSRKMVPPSASSNRPFLSRTAVGVLLRKKPRLVGIDTLVIDDPTDPTRPAHANFLKQKILIVENLTNLESLIDHQEFTFIAVPPKVKGAAAFPVRAFAMLPAEWKRGP